ncbi:MAG: hypothetical protein ACREOF_17510 [Gemmatimonadales bacterium]
MSRESIEAALRYLEQDLDLSKGFLVKLWGEEDAWAFVIKCHALLETAMSELLSGFLVNDSFQELISFLPMGGKTGKVAFLRSSALISATEQTFLDELQNLRNSLVHNVHSVRFDFQTFMTTNPKQAKRLGRAAAAFGDDGEVRKRYEAEFEEAPRHVLWLATLAVLARSRSALLKSEQQRRELAAHVRKLFEQGRTG